MISHDFKSEQDGMNLASPCSSSLSATITPEKNARDNQRAQEGGKRKTDRWGNLRTAGTTHWQGIWQPLPSTGTLPTEGNPSASNRKQEIKRMERIE